MPTPSRTFPFAQTHDGKDVPIIDKTRLYGATITVGAETGGTTIKVTIQLTDALGDDMAKVSCLTAYLSDNSDGSTVGSAHSTSPAINADGLLQALITDLVFLLTSESDGDIDIDFVDSGAQTIYLCLIMPDGSLVISDAIAHV